ncbi:MAG: site-2 protease family protein [Candidatus Binatia bacterium]
MASLVQNVSLAALPVLFAVILHEVAHGYVAYRLGDPTAQRMGRLSLNPLPHIDPVGTVLLPLALVVMRAPFVFGYARPVPVNYMNLRNPRRDMVLVAAAGPLTNFLLATVSVLGLMLLAQMLPPQGVPWTSLQAGVVVPLARMAQNSIYFNVGLAAFNLLPIPPLDGGRVLTGLLPRPLAVPFARLERYGFLILVALLVTNSLDVVLQPVMVVMERVLHALLS